LLQMFGGADQVALLKQLHRLLDQRARLGEHMGLGSR
jgi:hypothetical protein